MSSLPNQITALWFTCRLLGASGKVQDSFDRQAISRAIHDQHISIEKRNELRRVMEFAIFEKLRREEVALPGIATVVLEEIVVCCLNQYELLSPNIDEGKDATDHAYWVLFREVWAPTIHQVFRNRSGVGLGNEFRVPGNWYLPQYVDGILTTPVSNLLDRWLRATGLRTAYGLTKSSIKTPTEEQANAWEAEKKKLGRWLTGKNVPSLPDLFNTIEGHSDQAEWLDSADSWRARFYLAHALTKACNEAQNQKSNCPLDEIAKVFSELETEQIHQDDENILSNPETFFAVRLWIKHLKTCGEFESIWAEIPKRFEQTFTEDASDQEIENSRHKAEREIRPGNHIAAHLLELAGCNSDAGSEINQSAKVRQFLMNFATEELNRQLREKKQTARDFKNPRRQH